MNAHTPRSARSDRADAITVLALGAAAAIVTIAWAWRRAAVTFLPGGIGWHLRLGATDVQATFGPHTVQAVTEQGLVVAPDVNAVSVAAIIASLVASTLTGLIVIACVMAIAWDALRGKMFTGGMITAWNVLGWTLILGGGAIMLLDTLGGNGVLAAMGIADTDASPSRGFWGYAPMLAVGVASGLVAIAFRRGLALEQDTAGLV